VKVFDLVFDRGIGFKLNHVKLSGLSPSLCFEIPNNIEEVLEPSAELIAVTLNGVHPFCRVFHPLC
jgi:hypothetical protein